MKKVYESINDVRVGDKTNLGTVLNFCSKYVDTSGSLKETPFQDLEVIKQAPRKVFNYENAKDLKVPFKIWGNTLEQGPMIADILYVHEKGYAYLDTANEFESEEWDDTYLLEPPLPQLKEIEEEPQTKFMTPCGLEVEIGKKYSRSGWSVDQFFLFEKFSPSSVVKYSGVDELHQCFLTDFSNDSWKEYIEPSETRYRWIIKADGESRPMVTTHFWTLAEIKDSGSEILNRLEPLPEPDWSGE